MLWTLLARFAVSAKWAADVKISDTKGPVTLMACMTFLLQFVYILIRYYTRMKLLVWNHFPYISRTYLVSHYTYKWLKLKQVKPILIASQCSDTSKGIALQCYRHWANNDLHRRVLGAISAYQWDGLCFSVISRDTRVCWHSPLCLWAVLIPTHQQAPQPQDKR